MKDTTMQKALSFIKDKKFSFSIDFSETIQRFDRNGKLGNAWAIGKTIAMKDKTLQALYFGDFATGEKWHWFSEDALTPEQIKSMNEAIKKASQEYKIRRTKEQKEASLKAQTIWDRAHPGNYPHTYILKKQIDGDYGARFDGKGNFFVPLYDVHGTLWNIQRIDQDGNKRFYPKAKILGCFHTIGNISNEGEIYVCEGYATGVSIFKALEWGRDNRSRGNETEGSNGGSPTGMGNVGNLEPQSVETIQSIRDSSDIKTTQRGDTLELGGARAVGAGSSENARIRALEQDRSITLGQYEEVSRASIKDASDAEVLRESGPNKSSGNTNAPTTESHSASGKTRSGRPDRLERGARELEQTGQSDVTARDFRNIDQTAVAIAFNTSNLTRVCATLRKSYPKAKIIICADDDIYTTTPEGQPINPGRVAANEALQSGGNSIRLPHFADHESRDANKYTDFNDLYVSEGVQSVYEGLHMDEESRDAGTEREALLATKHEGIISPQLSLTLEVDSKGKFKMPSQQKVATALKEFYGDSLCRCEEDIFRFCGTHWIRLGINDKYAIKAQIKSLFGGLAEARHIISTYQLFFLDIECAPKNASMFFSNPYSINFLNGTLHIVKKERKYDLEFRPHNKLDYLINVLPFHYKENLKDNPEFHLMLSRVFEGDADKDQKIRAIRQMYGACLAPMFPRLFLLNGPPGTGKSTIIKIAKRLVNDNNCSSVDPSQFRGFNLSSMIGKLVNYDTDIDTTKPINDSLVKKIEDRHIFRIERKKESDVYAPLPAIHLFGANGMPKTLESETRAYERRWSFIRFDKVLTEADYDKDYDVYCFDLEPEGILKFALEGLKDLFETKGHFINPTSGKESMRQWHVESDPIESFFEDIKNNEILDQNTIITIEKEAKISPKKLWEIFSEEYVIHSQGSVRIKKQEFYKKIQARGFKIGVLDGFRYFKGIGPRVADKAQF